MLVFIKKTEKTTVNEAAEVEKGTEVAEAAEVVVEDQKKIVRKPLKDLNQEGTAVNKAAEAADSGGSNGLS